MSRSALSREGMWCGSPNTEKEDKEKPTVTAMETVGNHRAQPGLKDQQSK